MNQRLSAQSEAERRRSQFRHDMRNSFNVLLGYAEIYLEELETSEQEIVASSKMLVDRIRSTLRDTEYAIDRIKVDSEDIFIFEISRWLKKELLPTIKIIASEKAAIPVQHTDSSIAQQIDAALKRLTQQCMNPFGLAQMRRKEVTGDPQSGTPQISETTNSELQKRHLGRVLVIDDEWDNLVLLRHKLERLNCSVTALTSPKTGLTVAAESQFDVILVDLQMPEMTGLEFIEKVMEQKTTCNIPILVITAADDLELLSECIQKGAVDYLPKPCDTSILKARVLSCIERKLSADRERQMALELAIEKARSDELLNIIFPAETLAELKANGSVKPRRYTNVAVIFCDVIDFTSYCDSNPPEVVVAHLHSLFSEFDTIVELAGLQKIKSIGDAYMVAANLLRETSDPFTIAINIGMEMISAAAAHNSGWRVRVGLHIGDVVAGVVGTGKYLYDIWGDTVNIAARLEQRGEPMSVTVLNNELVKVQSQWTVRSLGDVVIKGKGTFELVSLSR